MSKLEELIARLCPDGVEYKELGEVLKIKNGKDYKGFDFGNIPVYGSGGIMTYIDQYVYDKPSVLIPRKGSIDKLYYVDTPFWNVDTIFYTEINNKIVLPRYVYHCLLKEHLEQYNTAGGVPSLTQKVLNKVKVPVPPLEVQREIVRVLDSYTVFNNELKEQLEKELAARQKPYEFYRDMLLNFDDIRAGGTNVKQLGYPYIPLGSISTIARGASPRPIKSFITDSMEGINWIKIGDVKAGSKYISETAEKITKEGAKKSRFVKKGDFILSNSMSFGRPYIMKIEGCIHDGWLSISDFNQYFLPDFLYHLLNSDVYQSIMRQKASFGGAVQNLNADIVKSMLVPMVPLSEQQRIVDILDRFDALCNDITSGLPAEIEARKKQYEYYRDKLLTFKELKKEA